MPIKTINTWDDFTAQVEELQVVRDAHAGEAIGSVPQLLYRGQPDSRMELKTTLERSVPGEIAMSKYYRFVSVIKAKVESVTDKNWTIPSQEEFEKWLEERQIPGPDLPGDAFLAYLRHHGLPSPLLDWTRSPYVAAHFAMAPQPHGETDAVAVYAYLESTTGIKIGDAKAPKIHLLGSYVTTHRRHYLQQSAYTICTAEVGRSLRYASHETVMARDDKNQDLLWKIVIPVSQRRVFIEHLQLMNINPFSLFDTEDALMEDIYLSEMFLRKHL